MSVFMVPRDKSPWPTLGPQVCEWIESYLVFGPGDLLGTPARLDDEKRALIYRMYEIYPKGHIQAGRRRFYRCGISLRKGTAKTELAAWIAAAELHPLGPVRCDGFDADGQPVGIGVTDPYIPMVAYTEEQSDELAYGALKVILEHSELADDFDIGLTRIMRIDGNGKAVSLATSPDARDGARTTFQLFDETHRLNSARLKAAHRTMIANLSKRKLADPWSLEITTAPSPGEGSVAEDTMNYAKQVAEGTITDSRLFFFHRQASDHHDLTTAEGLRAAVIEASGPAASWSDIDRIVAQWSDPTADKAYLERVWLNRLVLASDKAFDFELWKSLVLPDYEVPPGEMITVGFDGARWRDSVALVGTHIRTGFQWLLGLWEQPYDSSGRPMEGWEAPDGEINDVIDNAFRTWNVWRMYCDPAHWMDQVANWAGKYGSPPVVEFWTTKSNKMLDAIQAFTTSMKAREISHSGDPNYSRHIGNAYRKGVNRVDDNGVPLWLIYKERADSPFKIDAAMAGILSWQARLDALAAGVKGEIQDISEKILDPEWGM